MSVQGGSIDPITAAAVADRSERLRDLLMVVYQEMVDRLAEAAISVFCQPRSLDKLLAWAAEVTGELATNSRVTEEFETWLAGVMDQLERDFADLGLVVEPMVDDSTDLYLIHHVVGWLRGIVERLPACGVDTAANLPEFYLWGDGTVRCQT